MVCLGIPIRCLLNNQSLLVITINFPQKFKNDQLIDVRECVARTARYSRQNETTQCWLTASSIPLTPLVYMHTNCNLGDSPTQYYNSNLFVKDNCKNSMKFLKNKKQI